MILITERVTKRDLVGSKGVISVNMMYKSTFENFFLPFRCFGLADWQPNSANVISFSSLKYEKNTQMYKSTSY